MRAETHAKLPRANVFQRRRSRGFRRPLRAPPRRVLRRDGGDHRRGGDVAWTEAAESPGSVGATRRDRNRSPSPRHVPRRDVRTSRRARRRVAVPSRAFRARGGGDRARRRRRRRPRRHDSRMPILSPPPGRTCCDRRGDDAHARAEESELRRRARGGDALRRVDLVSQLVRRAGEAPISVRERVRAGAGGRRAQPWWGRSSIPSGSAW